jgi:hypothetical protein
MQFPSPDEIAALRALHEGRGVDRSHPGVQPLCDRGWATRTDSGAPVLTKDGREICAHQMGWQRRGEAAEAHDGRAR